MSGRPASLYEAPPPRDSGAVVPWRRRPDGEIEVYWVRRSESLRFMGGWYSFPGGAVGRRDAETAVRFGEHAFPPQGDPATARLLACAARELFEEIGILTAHPLAAGRVEVLRDLRCRLLAKQISFADVLASVECQLDASRYVFAGRWITPDSAPIRFDARFYLLEWPLDEPQSPEVIPGELDSGAWIRPRDALDRRERGEVLIPPPGVYILEVLAGEGPVAGLPRLQQPRDVDWGPFRRMEFLPGCRQFPLRTATLPPATHTNAFVLGTRELVLIDPGASDPAEIDALRQALDELRAEPGKYFTAIWLTHHHPDHVGSVEAARRFLHVPVCAHESTARRLADSSIRIDRLLRDGETILLQGEPDVPVEVIHTPGHARGHLCFWIPRLRALLAGDMVAETGTIIVDPPDGDMDDYIRSIDKLITLGPRYVLPAHGSFGPNGVAGLRALREHRLLREAKVLDAWRAGIRDPAEMLPIVYADADPRVYPLAGRQILAHLERLRKLGSIPADPREPNPK